MAYTKTEYTLAGGFTDADVLTKLGEVFAGLGLMTNSTAWFDSFTDTSGSEVRILEMEYTGNSGAYNKVYHAFFMGSTSAGLWYTLYYDWDTVTHESGGVTRLDQVSTYEHPDDVASWDDYYACLSLMSNASTFTITTYTDGSNIPLIVFASPGESRVYGFIPEASVLRGTNDYSYYGPPALLTLGCKSYYTVAPLVATDRSVTGRSDSGVSSNDWALSVGLGSHQKGGSLSASQTGTYAQPHTLAGIPRVSYRDSRTPYYTIARGLPSMTGYYDASLGVNCGLVAAQNENIFVPVTGDKLIVSAGVEEYEVLLITSSASTNDWYALVARTV